MNSYRRLSSSRILLDIASLSSQLSSVHLLEVGSLLPAYSRAHIPGASWLNTMDNLRQGVHMISAPNRFPSNSTRRIVLYEEAGIMHAARVWWVLHAHGFKHVQVLNGGWKEWSKYYPQNIELGDGQVVEQGKSEVKVSDRKVEIKDMIKVLEIGEAQIVDTRSWEEYTGKNSRGNKYVGRIPNAKFFDLNGLIQEGKITSDEMKIERVIEDTGISPHKETVVYCQSAYRAASTALILKEYGFENVRVYEGSMSEWNNTDDVPREI